MFEKIRNTVLISVLMAAVLFAGTACAVSASSDDYYYGDLGSNYYSFYGGPSLSVVVLGSGEVARGSTSTVQFDIVNTGTIQGFKSEKEVDGDITDIDTQLDMVIQNMEVENIKMITTAVGVSAQLVSDNPSIKVKTSTQNIGSLPTGASTSSPLKYTVEVGKDVAAGEYNLTMHVSYKYLRNVIYSADPIEGLGSLAGIRNLNASYWYTDVSKEIPVTIKVGNETRFEIVDVNASLSAKNAGMLYVTYKNTGEEAASFATARLSTSVPFSTTDDQSYLGTLAPGETAVASFRISVDENTVIYDKMYSINSEILYEDEYGNQKISDTLKISVTVPEDEGVGTTTVIIAVIVVLLIIVAGVYVYKSRSGKNGTN